MPNKSALAAFPAALPVSSRAPTPGDQRGVRVRRPLHHILARLDMQLESPPDGLPDCELRHFEPGALICAASAPLQACFVVCSGLVLRRGPDGDVRPATAIAGSDEALALHDRRTTQHTETLTAITRVELAVIDAPTLWAGEASEALLSRLIAGPQSHACIRCWARFGRIAEAQGAERLRRALVTLAHRLGDESPWLAHVHLELDALAAWLGMPLRDAMAGATLLQAQGLITVRDDVLRAIHPRAIHPCATGPTPW
jgi:CRP-like cAMP-binding protein